MNCATVASEAFRPRTAVSPRRDAAATFEVRTSSGVQGLLALKDEWAAITATRPEAGFHHAYDWHLSYVRNLERDGAPVHFFSFFRNGRPVAIFPLCRVTRTTIDGLPPLRLWQLPRHPHMNLCDGIMAREENGVVLAQVLVDALSLDDDLPWDALHLPNLLDDAQILNALRTGYVSRTVFLRRGGSMYFRCDDMASAMRNFTREFKRNLRRQRRHLTQLGNIEVSFVRERPALDAAYTEFLQLEASGWKGRGGKGSAIALHPQLTGFYRELMERFSADGRCLINLLKIDGKAIAAQFGIVAGTALNLLKIAYDESFRAVAPGNQLLHEVLKYCCDSPSLTRLSLVTGPSWAAERWNPEVHRLWDAYVFNSSARGISAYAATRLKSAVASAGRD